MKVDPDRPAFSVCDEHGTVTRPYRQHDKRRSRTLWRCRLCSLLNTKAWQIGKGRARKLQYNRAYHARHRVRIRARRRKYERAHRAELAAGWRRRKMARTGLYVPARGSRFYCRRQRAFTETYEWTSRAGKRHRQCKPCKYAGDRARKARLKEAA